MSFDTTRLSRPLASVTAAGALVVAGVYAVGTAHAAAPFSYEIAFQTSAGQLATVGFDGENDVAVPGGLAPDSNPSLTALPGPGFGFIAEFRATDGTLSSYDPFNSVVKRTTAIAAGTSPSSALAPTLGGFSQTFYRSSAGELWRIDGDSAPTRVGDQVAPKTSPGVAWNAASGLSKTAIVGLDGFLRQSTNGSAFTFEAVNVPVATGTSPSVAASTSDAAIAVNSAGGDLLVTRSSNRTANDTGLPIRAGSSPSIAAMSNGGFLTAFVAPDGTLDVMGPTGTNFPLGQKVAANSDPAIAADDHGGWQIAYSAAENGALSTYDYVAETNESRLVHSSTIVKAGTSPAIAVITPAAAPKYFDIGFNNQQTQFVNAVGTPNAVVHISGNVELDLSGYNDIQIAPGVQILGDRTTNPKGPRLYTTTFPPKLLTIGENGPGGNVRISGLRLDGGQTNPTESAGLSNDADAITVLSSPNVEIDHVELYRWRGTAVNIQDSGTADRLNATTAARVWVHDDYIHDNQHPTTAGANPVGSGHGAGYGVNVNNGAYALIERNVFDSNRHSITSDGRDGSGYLAYRNLFLNFGIGSVRTGFIFATQQIDVHGRNDCGIFGGYNCGPAGQYFDLAYNTVIGTDGVASAVHLRGTPEVGMDSENNVFAQSSGGAIEINETGYHDNGGNVFNATAFKDRKSCDFDGDGKPDAFMATGATWWYASSRWNGNWVYLNQSTRHVADVTLADVNGDGRCDVTSGGQQYITTDDVVRPSSLPGSPVPDVRWSTAASASSVLTAAGYAVSSQPYLDYSCSLAPGSVAVQDQFGIAPVVRRGPKPRVNIQVVEWPQCQS